MFSLHPAHYSSEKRYEVAVSSSSRDKIEQPYN